MKAWLASLDGGGAGRNQTSLFQYTALHWRSEQVPEVRFPACAAAIATEAGALLPPPGTPRGPSILLADIPSPGNNCSLWGVYGENSGSTKRQAALKRLLSGAGMGGRPLHKYDADVVGVDAGVLSIRDLLLATHAQLLLGCGDELAGGVGKKQLGSAKRGHLTRETCGGCYRARSKFTAWMMQHAEGEVKLLFQG